MSSEGTVTEPRPAYGPDDPEFYFEEQDQPRLGAELVGILSRFFITVTRAVVVTYLMAPVNRVFLLQCTEGELIHNGRLPFGGFGGLRGCVYYIITKEGVLGLFRGCFTEMLLSLPAYLLKVLTTVSILRLQQRLAPISWSAAVILGIVAPALRVVLTAPIVGFKNNALCNYTADIVARNGVTVALSGNKDEEEEAYLYNTAWEAAAAVRGRWGLKGLFFRGLDVDIVAVYTQSFIMRLMTAVVLPGLERFIREHTSRSWVRAAAKIVSAVGVHFFLSFVFQPLQVIRTRRSLLPLRAQSNRKQRRWFFHEARDIVRQDGITALWAGFRMRLLQNVGGILFSSVMTL